MHDTDQLYTETPTPKRRWFHGLVHFLRWDVLKWPCSLLVAWLTWMACEGVKASYREWQAHLATLPCAPEQWVTTREVAIKYRIIIIDGAEYILAQDRDGRDISLCPKVK